MPDSAIREFGQWITNHPWTEVLEVQDVHTKWTNFVSITTEAFHHHFPTKSTTMHPSDAPWMTPRIKRLIRQRDRAYHTCPDQYRRARNKVIREIKAVKANYYPDKIHQLKLSNNRKWFSSIKALCGLEKPSSPLPCLSHLTPNVATEQINDHFATVCQTLPSLKTSSLPAYLPAPSPPPNVQEIEVYKKLLKFKTNRSTTPTDLPIKIYREFAPEFATPLCSIINASLSQNSCPDDWKTSYVTPIPKITSPQSLNDLRPIAITPIPSLLCEDFVFDWAYDQICSSLDHQQFGNIKATSTSHYLVSFLDFIHSHLDERNTSLALAFIDFKKAFDLVDHTVVINKAISLGLSPNLVGWLSDFLTGRRQAVRFQGSISTFQHLTCGVPQGTKMGPLCFLILINDALTHTPHRWKYVDDCTVGIQVNNKSADYSSLQSTLDHLHEWTEANNMTINHSKTVVMHICTSTSAVPPPQLSVGTNILQVVPTAKLLGVTVDDKLTWKQHVSAIVRAASYKIYMLRRLKSLGAPADELKVVYITFILPTLMYASPAWSSSITLTQQHQLERVQKRACRVILGPSYTHYEDALATLCLPSLSSRHREALEKFGEGLLRHPRLRHLLPRDMPPSTRATRHPKRLVPPKIPRTERYRLSAVPTIVRLINK